MLIKTTLSDNLLPVVRALCLVKNNKTIEAVLAIKRSYNVRYRKNIVAKDEYVDVPVTDILEWYFSGKNFFVIPNIFSKI